MTAKYGESCTLARAASYLGVSVRTVQRLGKAGKFTVMRYSTRCTRVDTHSLIAYRTTTFQRPTSSARP